MGEAAIDYFLRQLLLPSLEKREVLILAPQVVREHHGYLVDYRIISPAFRAEEHPVDYYLPVSVELHQLEGIVLVDGTGQDIEELPLHTCSRVSAQYKSFLPKR